MFVWGDYNSLLDRDFNTVGLYNSAADTWTPSITTNAPWVPQAEGELPWAHGDINSNSVSTDGVVSVERRDNSAY